MRKQLSPTPDTAGPSWLTVVGHAKDSLWSLDLFRCESAVGVCYRRLDPIVGQYGHLPHRQIQSVAQRFVATALTNDLRRPRFSILTS